MTKEVEEIITELMRTQPKVVISTAIRDEPEMVLKAMIDFSADTPAKKAMIRAGVIMWVRGER